jgi:hypothetical protein
MSCNRGTFCLEQMTVPSLLVDVKGWLWPDTCQTPEVLPPCQGRLQARNRLFKVPHFATIKRAVKRQKTTEERLRSRRKLSLPVWRPDNARYLSDTSGLYLSESLKAVHLITGLM